MSDSTEAINVYNSLTDLGLHKDLISLDDFLRLYRADGPLRDALLFFSEHVKGRAGVIEARTQLLRSAEYRSKSNIKQRSDATKRSANDIAVSRLAKANKDMEIYSQELGIKVKTASETHTQLTTVKSQILTRRRVDLILEMLLDKEKERIRRMEEMRSMLVELKRKIPSPSIQCKATTSIDLTSPRRTQDALATLQAYQIRLERLVAQNPDTRDSTRTRTRVTEAESQLRSLVARKLGLESSSGSGAHNEQAEVDRVTQEFINAARDKARKQVRYPSTENMLAEGVSKKELDTLASEVKRKITSLQEVSDLSLKLASSSQQALTSVISEILPPKSKLQLPLPATQDGTRGYVDRLRAGIVNNIGEAEQVNKPCTTPLTTFDQETRRILGLNEAATSAKVLEEVKRMIRSVHNKTQYLNVAAAKVRPALSVPPEKEEELLALYESQKRETEESTEKLLTRKIAKADLGGHGLVQDIEILLKEVHDIVGISHASDPSTRKR
ncbi:hypothetical protein BT96DRAFT_920812 [Gymnopus androsaceus JB14]|uniref:Uncharacterized protein n=1 Tax=Gymnopus androsaceus JB14 TaxID=1447944 RepID=A0A6A4HK71_9AGAR|nr:hypothetical protein BT96DRAFT_920812 [Gymnopus androsaceus JB14]